MESNIGKEPGNRILDKERHWKVMSFQTVDDFKRFNYDDIEDDGEVLNFEDTYDGLGDALEEDSYRDDDETFGGSAADISKLLSC